MTIDSKQLQALYALLQSHSDMPFVQECIDNIENEEIVFNEGYLRSKEDTINNFQNHFDIQVQVTSARVEGYNTLLPAIKEYLGSTNRELKICTKACNYIIICDGMITNLLGILKSPHSNIDIAKKVYFQYISNGVASQYLKFYKGKLQEW
ncbi:MAG: hypothetical protein WCG87_04235 [Bacteroidota bacterium]